MREPKASDQIISIHTPAKGVTWLDAYVRQVLYISIHTPAKGVTGYPLRIRRSARNFNPHSREGSDPDNNDGWIPVSEFQSTLPRRE